LFYGVCLLYFPLFRCVCVGFFDVSSCTLWVPCPTYAVGLPVAEGAAELVSRLFRVLCLSCMGDIVASPLARPKPVLAKPHLAVVGAVVLATLPEEGMRLAVIGASPGEFHAASADGLDLRRLSVGGEHLQFDLAETRLFFHLRNMLGSKLLQINELIALVDPHERNDALLVFFVELVRLGGESHVGAIAVMTELLMGGTGLFVITALVIGDAFVVRSFLGGQIAIGRLGADANRSLQEGLCVGALFALEGSGSSVIIRFGVARAQQTEARNGVDEIVGHAWIALLAGCLLRFYYFWADDLRGDFSFNFFEAVRVPQIPAHIKKRRVLPAFF